MKTSSRPLSAAALLLLCAGVIHGSTLQYCPSNAGSVCYSVGVPTSSASSGSGNIYFQISAPTSYEWVALGTGSSMAGSNIFLMYQDGSGNLTLSPRRGANHVEPQLDTSSTAAKLTLLAGSGVSSDGNTMVANVKCANCETWSGGTLSLTSSSSGWIAAWKQGSSLATKSQSANIAQHDDTATFQLDLTKATVSSDSNPFVGSSSSSSGSGSGSGTGSGSGSGSDSGSGVTVVSASKLNNTVLVAHGVIMALVMAALYPLGSVLMPLLGKWWVHAAWQTVTFCLMWVGFGLGVQTAMDRSMLFQQAHTILGTVVTCLLVVQPVLGLLHHRHYLAHKSRGLVSHAHIWYGRTLIVLGIVNGGLGLQLALAPNSLIIAYSVVAGVIFLCYIATKLLTGRQRQLGGGTRKDGTGSPRSTGGRSSSREVPRRPYQDSRRGERHV
ncbi:hypothetical protein QBC46DRAFT_16871 [Diplogelasinospora grovesii]|uniref:DOMON domain-containing protein n=1 Tax=Diplogelasinospora grovesii TaxID=303347 RepID=A0AAN6N178_9PEZI|nr:hypothetical protein QBC46DRAFT_16871 [Diplogelasinospora grovesii]